MIDKFYERLLKIGSLIDTARKTAESDAKDLQCDVKQKARAITTIMCIVGHLDEQTLKPLHKMEEKLSDLDWLLQTLINSLGNRKP